MQEGNYVKYNRTVYKDRERREEGKMVLLAFFKANELVINGFTGFLIMDSETDPKERIVLTFWKSKESMIAFYNEENNVLTSYILVGSVSLWEYITAKIIFRTNL